MIDTTRGREAVAEYQLKQAIKYCKEQFGLGSLRGTLSEFGWNTLANKGLV